MSAAGPSWRPPFSPQGYWNTVPPADAQAALRQAFADWGRPERLRVDNGTPWGSKGDLPTDLALWLIGLGVDLTWNPARRPQDNGVVERAQGTGKRWGEPHTCDGPAELQGRFDELDQLQREWYPYADGQSRWDVFPGLRHSGRTYSPAWEERHWSLRRVAEHLAGYAVARRVDGKGQVSLYDRKLYLGVTHRDQPARVLFDALTHEWVFAGEDGQEWRRLPAEEIGRERIRGLRVTHRRARRKGGAATGRKEGEARRR